jgi:diaminopimelate epimerase
VGNLENFICQNKDPPMNKTKPLTFTKMHGLGNDFVVLNAMQQAINTHHLPISTLGARHTGIGFDQLLIIEPSTQADFFCRIFNADGSEAEQCGNGLRCVARFIHEEGLCTQAEFNIETLAGVYAVRISDYEHIRIVMGVPHIAELGMQLGEVQVDAVLSVGNPHALIKVPSIEMVEVAKVGLAVSKHAHFPHGANVGFMQVLDKTHVRLRTYERAVGETFACGSNACAAVVAGIARGWLESPVKVAFKQGTLEIEWAGEKEPVVMTGAAARVFEGEIFW